MVKSQSDGRRLESGSGDLFFFFFGLLFKIPSRISAAFAELAGNPVCGSDVSIITAKYHNQLDHRGWVSLMTLTNLNHKFMPQANNPT